MKDSTIAAAINKYVDSRLFGVGLMLHSFEQKRPTHNEKYRFVHCLNVIRKNHIKMERATDSHVANRILLDTMRHAEELEALEGAIY